LGLSSKNDPRGNTNYTTSHNKKFLMPLKECEFSLNSFLDDLQPDFFPKIQGERKANCAGLAVGISVSLLESLCSGEPGRIMLFLGNPPNIGLGKVVGNKLTETIRNFVDFSKNNPNTVHFKPAIEYYEGLAQRVSKSGHSIDVFSCCLNQTGLLEMKCLVEKTGGYMILTDSFSTLVFKESFRKIFSLDENGFFKMSFRGKLELFITPPFKVGEALGNLVPIKQGSLNAFAIGSFDDNTSYSFVLDIDSSAKNTNINNSRRAVIQILTTYISGDRSTILRVTTFSRKISSDLESNKLEVAQSFDQESSATLIAKICVEKSYKEENIEIIRWLDKSLIRLVQKFAEYVKEDSSTFKLSKEFFYFPQFIFYLRKSTILQFLNASPDEITYSKSILIRENVNNSTIMIQPILFQYTPENPEANPVILDVKNMKNDCVLLLDAFFFICVWHGDNVCKWRDEGFHNDPEYENIKQMLEFPQDYAQNLLVQRNPVPRFVCCDSGSGQERLIKFILGANSEASNKTIEEGFISDDVSYKVFMDHLAKKAVQI
jgi:protein transport protein SEC23